MTDVGQHRTEENASEAENTSSLGYGKFKA